MSAEQPATDRVVMANIQFVGAKTLDVLPLHPDTWRDLLEWFRVGKERTFSAVTVPTGEGTWARGTEVHHLRQGTIARMWVHLP